MQRPIEIVFEDIEPSEFLDKRIREEADKLERYFDHITGMRVTFSKSHRRQRKGNAYDVRIVLSVPGHKDVIVNKSPGNNETHDDPYVTLRDAFHAARRQLEDRSRVMRGKVKTHDAMPEGAIVKLFPSVSGGDGYGFLEGAEGAGEIYFHENSLVGAPFGLLKEGTRVRYVAESGAEGLQASSVQLVGKHLPSA